MKLYFAAAVFAVGLGIGACSSSSQSLSYDLSEGGCDTGSHQFDSTSAMCAGLEDYKLNNDGCAYDLRKQQFQSAGCSGDFQETDT